MDLERGEVLIDKDVVNTSDVFIGGCIFSRNDCIHKLRTVNNEYRLYLNGKYLTKLEFDDIYQIKINFKNLNQNFIDYKYVTVVKLGDKYNILNNTSFLFNYFYDNIKVLTYKSCSIYKITNDNKTFYSDITGNIIKLNLFQKLFIKSN